MLEISAVRRQTALPFAAMLKITCPHCQSEVTFADVPPGTQVRCRKCKKTFETPAGSGAALPALFTAPPRAAAPVETPKPAPEPVAPVPVAAPVPTPEPVLPASPVPEPIAAKLEAPTPQPTTAPPPPVPPPAAPQPAKPSSEPLKPVAVPQPVKSESTPMKPVAPKAIPVQQAAPMKPVSAQPPTAQVPKGMPPVKATPPKAVPPKAMGRATGPIGAGMKAEPLPFQSRATKGPLIAETAHVCPKCGLTSVVVKGGGPPPWLSHVIGVVALGVIAAFVVHGVMGIVIGLGVWVVAFLILNIALKKKPSFSCTTCGNKWQ